MEKLHTDVTAQPTNDSRWLRLAENLSVLGRHDEALAAGRKATELVPEASDAWSGPRVAERVAILYARAGQTGWALNEYARLLRNGRANVHELRVGPLPAAVKSDPRFQKLLNDPKNNAPLF